MKATFCILGIILQSVFVFSQPQIISLFDLSQVSISCGPFYMAQQTDMKYILEMDVDRLLAPFLTEAGIETKAQMYGNWENTGLNGHIGGHYLTALSLMYSSTGNKELLDRLNYMIDELEMCQEKNGNGYVGGIPGGKAMWEEIARGNINAGSFSLNKKWVPWYNIHKLYAGLRDAYQIAGIQKAKTMLIKLTDWSFELTKNLSDQQIQEMLKSEHGGMNEIFADVYEITSDSKYLELAEKFSHRIILDPLLLEKDELNRLHANTQIPKVIGYEKIAELSGNGQWHKAADFFWKTVVENRTVSIGGNSVREHFHPADDFSSMIESNQGPETCNTYNMLKLTKMLFCVNPDAKYINYYEQALYNHILSSQHPDGGFVYFTPMRPRHYRVYSQPQECFWCCVGSGLENHGKYSELIYAYNENNLFINLFIPSTLKWKEKNIQLIQKTKFPEEEKSIIELRLTKPQKINLNIRIPQWLKNNKLVIKVNGDETDYTSEDNLYASIEKKWKNGDKIEIILPMQIYLKNLPDGSDWASVMYGPLVLAAATDTTDLDGLFADDSRMGHVANGKYYPVNEAPMLVIDKKEDLSLIHKENNQLIFNCDKIIYPENYSQLLKLVPFYTIHNARYMIYWRVSTHEKIEQIKKEIKAKEAKMLALESITIDQVAPGEQQPESDHNIQGGNTESGIFNDRYWRHAVDSWFSYDLKDVNSEANILRITYTGVDKGRSFDILINDILLVTIHSKGSEQLFFDEDYSLSDEIKKSLKNRIYTVKFQAHKGSVAGGIYYVRLIK